MLNLKIHMFDVCVLSYGCFCIFQGEAMSAALEIATWMCFLLFHTFSCCFLGIFYQVNKKRALSECKADIWLK